MTVTRDVDVRAGRPGDSQLAEVEPIVLGEMSWFKNLLPRPDVGGLDPQMFVTRLVWLLRKSARGDGKLLAAAHNDPESFLFAATECASWNVVPGEEYWFVPFEDKVRKTGLHVTGMPGWKGEEQQILRTGAAQAVVKEIVYRDAQNPALADEWEWLPTEMRLPRHRPVDSVSHAPANVWKGYGFVWLATGGHTQPVVLNEYEIELARSHSRSGSEEFWGKLGNDGVFRRGKFYAAMVRKTVIHRLYDEVPHSAGYVTQLMEAFAKAANRFPAIQMPGITEDDGGARLSLPGAVPGTVVPPATPPDMGDPRATARIGTPGGDTGPWPEGAQAEPAASMSTQGWLGRVYSDLGWGGDELRPQRLAVTRILAADAGAEPLRLVKAGDLTEQQARRAIKNLGTIAKNARDAGRKPAADLQKLYDTLIAKETAGADTAGSGAENAEPSAETSAPGSPGDPGGGQGEIITAALAAVSVTDPGRVAEACSAYAHRPVTGPGDLTAEEASYLLEAVQRCEAGEEPGIAFSETVDGWIEAWARTDPDTHAAWQAGRAA